MKEQSIKWKVTLWYTFVVSVILSIVLAGMLFFIQGLENNAAKEEVSGKAAEFFGKIKFVEGEYQIPDEVKFYEDGVLISVYSEGGVPVEGSIPEEFPIETTLKDGCYQHIDGTKNKWLVYDSAHNYGDGKTLWIRAVSTTYGFEMVAHEIIAAVIVLLMLLTVFLGVIGYIMLSKALRPVETICREAGEISRGEDLSKRLTVPEVRNEMYRLSEAFNQMFDRLEESFETERQFASDVSHELRTPLAVIHSQCEYMLEECKEEHERQEVQIILNQANRMITLISQLLTISRCEIGSDQFHMEVFDFSFMADMVVDTLQESAGQKEISIEHKIEAGIHFYGEETLLMRMLMNLIENAIFYGKNDGHIKVSIQKREGYIEGIIEDDGIGIAQENLSKIWKRFYREDKSRKSSTNGTGLGLSMVKWIIQIHGGKIWAESEKGVGSAFTFVLPLRKES